MEQTTNIRLILDKVMRHPLMQDLNFETAIDFTVDFMRIVGCPAMFEERVDILEVKNYRAILPCDFHNIIQIRDLSTKRVYINSSDSFHMGKHDNSYDDDYTYKIQGRIIYTSTKECKLEVAYRVIAVDDEGYPLIPDNSSFTRALELYIKKQWFTILFDTGKINGNILQNTQQEYAWAVGDCQTEFSRLSLDEMESFSNSWNTLLMRTNEHRSGFKYNNKKEHWRIH